MSLAEACDQNGFPHQKPILPSFGLVPAEYLSQHKYLTATPSDLNSDLCYLYLPPFHCTRLYQYLKRELTEDALIFLLSVYLFAFHDCPQVLFHLVSIVDA